MKAVLVIDMPENGCKSCPLVSYGDKCSIEIEHCPLRPLPKKIKQEEDVTYMYGWNDCLDEITGETE